MVSPFHGYDGLFSVWAHAAPVVAPRADVAVTIRFPGDSFKKLQGYLSRDLAVMAMNRLLQFATEDVRQQMRGVFSKADISNACALTLDQIHSILDAPSDADAAIIHVMDKRVSCFKWNASWVGPEQPASELDTALIDSLNKANQIIQQGNDTLAWSKRVR